MTHEFEIDDEPTTLHPNVHYYRLDGTTRHRQEVIDRFNNPRSPVRLFLISTLAGGFGISLTGASRAILYDVSWNPASDYQATCRCYRYGQTRPVFIYRLMQQGTVEESIWNRSCAKTWLSQRVVDQRAAERRLTKDDLLLFEASGADLATPAQLRAAAKSDSVLRDLLEQYARTPHAPRITGIDEHDSLFSEDRRDALSERERSGLAKDLAYQRLLEQQRDAGAAPRVGPLTPSPKLAKRVPARGARLREIAQQYATDRTKVTAKRSDDSAAAVQNAALRFEMLKRRKEEEARNARQLEQERTDSVNSMLAAKRSAAAPALPELFAVDSSKRLAAQTTERRRQQEASVESMVMKVLSDVHAPPSVPPPPPSVPPPSVPPPTGPVALVKRDATAATSAITTVPRPQAPTKPKPAPRPSPVILTDDVPTEELPTPQELKAERDKAAARRDAVFGRISFKRQSPDGVEPSADAPPPPPSVPPALSAPSAPSAPPAPPTPLAAAVAVANKRAKPDGAPTPASQSAAQPPAPNSAAQSVLPPPAAAPKDAPTKPAIAAAVPTDAPTKQPVGAAALRIPSVTAAAPSSAATAAPAAVAATVAAAAAPRTPQEQFKHLVAKYYAAKLAQLRGKMSHDELKQLNMQLTKQYVTSHVRSEHCEQLEPEVRADLKNAANKALAAKGLGLVIE